MNSLSLGEGWGEAWRFGDGLFIMKRRLNLLCAVILLVLGWSVVMSGYYLFMGASLGVRAGWNYAEAMQNPDSVPAAHMEDVLALKDMSYVSLVPDAFRGTGNATTLLRDSVYNELEGRYVPACYATLLVSVEKPEAPWQGVVTGLASLVSTVAIVWALVLFIRLIVAINKSQIFLWRNIRRLRVLGFMLLASFACSWLAEYINLCNLREVLSIPGYGLDLTDATNVSTLLLGLCALIVAEVFAIGLRMKEEQDLTI